jgi:hypothetical protein
MIIGEFFPPQILFFTAQPKEFCLKPNRNTRNFCGHRTHAQNEEITHINNNNNTE